MVRFLRRRATKAVARTDDPALEEARHQYGKEFRLINQALSMQAWIRDRDKTVATSLTLTVLAASVVGLAYAFANNDDAQVILGVKAERATWLGLLAVVTFVISLTDLVVDRRGAASRREDAVSALFLLKREYLEVPKTCTDVGEYERLRARYGTVMDSVPDIPERLFNRLKARHLRKVAVSRYLTDHPGTSARAARRATKSH